MTSQEPIRRAAVARRLRRLTGDRQGHRVDLVIMNRFGRAESLGGGLLSSLALAVAAELPVLIAVRAL